MSTDLNAGFDTTRPSTVDTTQRDARARQILSDIACDMFGVSTNANPDEHTTPEMRAARQWRDDMYQVLGLTQPNQALPAAPAAPAANPTGGPRVVTRIRRGGADDDWRKHSRCRDEDPELFHPIGTSGPALLQVEQAKAVCRRCPVVNDCLDYALGHQEFGIAGGMTEDERRSYKRRPTRHRAHTAA